MIRNNDHCLAKTAENKGLSASINETPVGGAVAAMQTWSFSWRPPSVPSMIARA
jgi:hypothetical protein